MITVRGRVVHEPDWSYRILLTGPDGIERTAGATDRLRLVGGGGGRGGGRLRSR